MDQALCKQSLSELGRSAKDRQWIITGIQLEAGLHEANSPTYHGALKEVAESLLHFDPDRFTEIPHGPRDDFESFEIAAAKSLLEGVQNSMSDVGGRIVAYDLAQFDFSRGPTGQVFPARFEIPDGHRFKVQLAEPERFAVEMMGKVPPVFPQLRKSFASANLQFDFMGDWTTTSGLKLFDSASVIPKPVLVNDLRGEIPALTTPLLKLQRINYWRARLNGESEVLGYIADPILIQYFDQEEFHREQSFRSHSHVFQKARVQRPVGSGEEEGIEVGSPRHPLYFTANGQMLPPHFDRFAAILRVAESINAKTNAPRARVFVHSMPEKFDPRPTFDFYRGIDDVSRISAELEKLKPLRMTGLDRKAFAALDALLYDPYFQRELIATKVSVDSSAEYADLYLYFKGRMGVRVLLRT